MTFEELNQIKINRSFARQDAILKSKECREAKATFCLAEATYEDAVRTYQKIDREYAFALYDEKKKKLKKVSHSKAYNPAKRTAAKALKALESLPPELRAKIIADAQDGLF